MTEGTLGARSIRAEVAEVLRSLIERVVLHPVLRDGRAGFEVELVGEIAAMVRLGMGMPSVWGKTAAAAGGRGLFESSVKVVAGAGFEPAAFRL